MKIIKSTLAPFLDDLLPVGGILLNAAGNLPPDEIKTLVSPSVILNCYASLLSLKFVHWLLFIHRCTFFVPIQIYAFEMFNTVSWYILIYFLTFESALYRLRKQTWLIITFGCTSFFFSNSIIILYHSL